MCLIYTLGRRPLQPVSDGLRCAPAAIAPGLASAWDRQHWACWLRSLTEYSPHGRTDNGFPRQGRNSLGLGRVGLDVEPASTGPVNVRLPCGHVAPVAAPRCRVHNELFPLHTPPP